MSERKNADALSSAESYPLPPEETGGAGKDFYIVGVGASAGGLESLGALLRRLSLKNMAMVVVQHLAPQHDSALPALLGRSSEIEVLSIEDGMEVQPNHIYVMPPNSDLAILHGALHLLPPAHGHDGIHLPIDYFFRSLAADQGPRSIGVILSGTGTDGTFGIRAIKEAGGINLVQEPATAKYDGMPRSAVQTGDADFCLPPEGIAEELVRIGHQSLQRAGVSVQQFKEGVGRLLGLLRNAFGHDLTHYKSSTIERRIERRMVLHKIEQLADYIKYAQTNAEELRLLYRDMLINVTSFFRDQESFTEFRTKILPQILSRKQIGAPLRLWVPACATGEEAYSFAICLLEVLGDKAADYRLQIFGTDVDTTSVQYARRGIYPQNISQDLTQEQLRRFFTKRDNKYQVSRHLRDMVIFSEQNVTKDAPFSRLDLVSCRNLLIYLQPDMQKRVLRMFHYALDIGGFLLLGTSETAGEASELFSLVDRKTKFYAKKNVTLPANLGLSFGMAAPETGAPPALSLNHRTTSLPNLIERKILELYGPPGVVINRDLDILHIRGRTGPYLEPMPGAPSFNILRLARPEIQGELRRAIREAQTSDRQVSVDCKILRDGEERKFLLEVIPISDPDAKSGGCLLILFHEPRTDPIPLESTLSPEDQRHQELERELLVTKEYLQTTIEELESANEELKSSNEELQSSNEELQSTNEELETSKEELQSSNEELTTVNDELQGRMEELQQSNDDLHNVMTGIGSAVILVGLDLRIRRYSQAAEKLLKLVPGDVGRPLSQINTFVRGQRVEDLASEVIEELKVVQKDVLCSDQHWYELHLSPYKTRDHSIRGAVIALAYIGAQSRASNPGPTTSDG